jgi:hypothetical protein
MTIGLNEAVSICFVMAELAPAIDVLPSGSEAVQAGA